VPLVGHYDWSIFTEFCVEIEAEDATVSVIYRGAHEFTRKQDRFSWPYFISHEDLLAPGHKLISTNGKLTFKVTIEMA